VARSVLVVDDDAPFRELVTRILSAWGHKVIGEAATVAEALARAIELQPDTVLVDIGLPDGDGFRLTEQLHVMPWAPRIVVISSDSDVANGPAALRAGAVGFLPKEELSDAILRQLIESS
jgi:DNA-binding NarL/FixJ family response regulator